MRRFMRSSAAVDSSGVITEWRSNANDFLGERTEQVDAVPTRPAVASALRPVVTRQYERIRPLGCGAAGVVAQLDAPHHTAAFATNLCHERKFLQRHQSALDDRGACAHCTRNIASRELVQCCKYGSATHRVRAPGVRPFTVIQRTEQVRASDCRRDRNTVPETLP